VPEFCQFEYQLGLPCDPARFLGIGNSPAHLGTAPSARQRVIEVTAAITIASDAFAFALPVDGLTVIPRRGTVLAHDGDTPVRTPYDDCVLIMPTRRPKCGDTAVRLGRFAN
jgi:hypothetical protein